MELTKKQKELQFTILDRIYAKGPISRIDISNETGITPATVSKITGNMINENLIHEIGEATPIENKSGRKKILLDISNSHSFYIGTELSEKYISFCLTDNFGKIISKKIIKLNSWNVKETLTISYYIDRLKEFINSCDKFNPKGIGVAIPGHFDKKEKRIISNNSFWKNFNVKEVMNNIDLPIFFENNVHCMTLAERIFRLNNCNDSNFMFFHIGRGMFCSYMYNGNLYEKDNFLIGEVGHVTIHPDGELCECGKRGCLQTYASEAWIIKKSQILFENSETTYLRQLATDTSRITIGTILKAYNLGDQGIINILHSAIKYLSITINNYSIMIGSNRIFMHGELFNELSLQKLLKEYLDKNINLLALNNKQNITFKKYSKINSALAAASLCVSKLLIENINIK